MVLLRKSLLIQIRLLRRHSASVKKQPNKAPLPTTPQEHREIVSAATDAPFDPIENAMRRHPGLTRAKAEEIAEAFGF